MENKGLIYKKVDQRDTRLKAILLTDKAIKLEEK